LEIVPQSIVINDVTSQADVGMLGRAGTPEHTRNVDALHGCTMEYSFLSNTTVWVTG
jgi:hypothetical protein